MTRKYRSHKRLEEKKNIRKAYLFASLTVVLGILLFLFGLPVVVKFASFLTNIRQSSAPIEITDSTPPAPPRFSNLAEFTNDSSVAIEGNAEPGVTVTLLLNGKEREVVVGKNGKFEVTFPLRAGVNSLTGFSIDLSGNKSKETDVVKIVYDSDPPSLSVDTPSDGATFFGPKERQVIIEGATDPDAAVVINDRFVSVENDGSFSFVTTLNEGGNDFVVIAKDKAGNETQLNFKLNYTP